MMGVSGISRERRDMEVRFRVEMASVLSRCSALVIWFALGARTHGMHTYLRDGSGAKRTPGVFVHRGSFRSVCLEGA